MKQLSYNIVLVPEPEGGYTVTVPALPGCVSYGKTVEEARAKIADAIQGYLYSLKKHHQPIPKEDHSLISFVQIGEPIYNHNLSHAAAV